LRILDGNLIAQAYSSSYGFDGDIFYILPKKTGYQKLHTFKLPVKANIYDFYVFDNAVFKWEDNGSLAVYNNQGIPVWRSRETFGIGQQYEKRQELLH